MGDLVIIVIVGLFLWYAMPNIPGTAKPIE